MSICEPGCDSNHQNADLCKTPFILQALCWTPSGKPAKFGAMSNAGDDQRARSESGPSAAGRVASDIGGAFGDLGTFLPHVLGAITVAGLAPVGVLSGFGLCYVATGLFYRLPIPVQPMKAVSAVLITSGLSAGEIAASGLCLGLVLLVLGITGAISRFARIVPQSVITGLQLGLGITLALLSLELMAGQPWLGIVTAVLLLATLRVPRCPATLVALGAAIVLGHFADVDAAWPDIAWAAPAWPVWRLPGLGDFERALGSAVLPQLPLTLTNAVIVTAALAHDFYGERAARATPRNLALSSGLANLLLAPFGALPMCHGAGGLAAHRRFGARTGLAPVILGILLLGLGIMLADQAGSLLALVPLAAVGALLLFSAADLALSKRLFDARPSCWPVIGVTAAATAWLDPFWGLLAGALAELLRGQIIALLRGRAPSRPPR
ncbi:MAG TPA: putative sulfate/molybdate transporter [Alphaproteobacteria bacterium]|nr:putative sulfate/molybdate transporter [Alphaproteobacteria bacterium]